ncbi:hypothetical protein SDRG_13321 [Saprolegnia diclina VS20]|uniref:Uncharacterized protein n=1 Tax=Saprolegnia diclina (strain VS20) TaxID=1156394 RepID=T0PU18_SAPDV|nr:hypothetical protein SDRG_13321 [Saprolegnia diclina VS20]EQC28984.1 hypothetical protein SDRG_13321 [Saprolegnia diclina VS20]|eukprot:XP_008617623.1 hypothetical protein SDRG_13321 [Saprolegnia diclina VS20]
MTQKIDFVDFLKRVQICDRAVDSNTKFARRNIMRRNWVRLYKLLAITFWWLLGNIKFEMLLVLAFNKQVIGSETDDRMLVDAHESATFASQAAVTLINFFDLNTSKMRPSRV